MIDIREIIKTERPNISPITLNAYVLNIKKLHRGLFGNDNIESLDFLKDTDRIFLALGGNLKSTMKNYLVAIVVLLMSNKTKYEGLIKKYQDKIKSLQDDINDKYDDNEKTDKQKENWVEYNDILKLLRKMKKDTKPLLEKEQLTNKEKDLIQQYLVLYLYSGKAFPVLRNDFAEMKIVNEGEDVDKDKNYFVIKKKGAPLFRLNEYKTAKFQGEKDVPVKDMELRKLINKWAKINGTGYLLINITNNTPMKANGISKYLNKIFDKHFNKKISTSLLRSIYISHKYNGDKQLSTKDKKELANEMGHTKQTAETIYNKID
tara:strand:+ start:380 stop:1336 length:957 start_codon:yes stop_codon:yes gene_type:complete